jgi:hypothetical protein
MCVRRLSTGLSSALVCLHRMRIYSGTADAVAAVRAGSVVAYITDYSTLKYFASVHISSGSI